MASSISSIWRRRSSRDGVLSDIGPRYLHGKAELLIVGGPGKIKENLAFQPLRTGYARPAQSAAAGGASPEESPEETIDRLAKSEEHTSELQSLMRTSYAVFCLKKK